MAYMLYHRYKAAVRDAYAGRSRDEVAQLLNETESFRRWIDALEIDRSVRAGLSEQLAAIEEAFRELSHPVASLS